MTSVGGAVKFMMMQMMQVNDDIKLMLARASAKPLVDRFKPIWVAR